MASRLIEAMDPAKGLRKDARIALKPNLVVARDWRSGATTHPDICAAVVEYFQARGFSRIRVIESAWVGESTQRAFRVCGYEELARRYGVELVDVKKDQYETREYGGFTTEISKAALDADVLVNLPLIKGHCQTNVTCALKNMKGLISDREKRRFHTLGLHEPIAKLNSMIRPALTIADGIWTDPGFEEGGNPVRGNVMVAGDDSVLLDAFAARRLGLNPRDIGYIRIAEQLGIGSGVLGAEQIVELGGSQTEVAAAAGVPEAVQRRIDECGACSACYAALASALMQMSGAAGDITVCVGQGFRGRRGKLGCGNCTAGFEHNIQGCPPKAEDIVQYLKAIKE
jgi:uncharacterized protein (DUF362 family)